MIPKVIHYCWFGRNEKTDLINRCTMISAIVIYTITYCTLSWKFTMNEYEKSLVYDVLKK